MYNMHVIVFIYDCIRFWLKKVSVYDIHFWVKIHFYQLSFKKKFFFSTVVHVHDTGKMAENAGCPHKITIPKVFKASYGHDLR